MARRTLTILLALISAAQLYAAETVWKASWLTKQYYQSATNTWIAFRKKVDIEKVPESVTAKVAADTKYWLWINDTLVAFEGGLKRGPAPGDGYYDEFEIAPYLKAGDNLIAVLVWHLGQVGFSHMDSGICAMIFDAQSSDGTLEILSDRSWEASEYLAYSTASGPAPNYRLPESNLRYDARKAFVDWNKTSYRKRLGGPMVTPFRPGDAPLGKLVKRPIPMWKDYGMRDYVSTRQSGDTLICRLPYNCQATPWFKVEAPSGRVIRMETDHRIVTGVESVRAEYVTKAGVQEYESIGWMNGEEMRYIFPSDVKVLDVKYRETGYDTELCGTFRCDDPVLNEYWEKAVRTLYVCMRDTYYDCPDRERAQWWGDEVNELTEAFFMLSRSADKLALKGIRELVGWQRADGAMYAPIPTGNYFCELPNQILASVGWYGFHNFWFYSGDDSFIQEVYDAVHKYLHETWKIDENGLPIFREGEWNWGDTGADCLDKLSQYIPWYYLALKGEAAFARKLGKVADVAEDEAMMARINESFNRIYWDGKAYRAPSYEGGADDRVQALAVVSGLADRSKYDAITEIIRRQDCASAYFERYVVEALFMMGEEDLALAKMRKLLPTIMSEDCSTLWEAWDHSGTSNHAWSGGVAIEMVRKMAGVEPLEPGFSRFRVSPQMASLKFIETSFESACGKIELSLHRKGARTELILSVPEGSVAEVPAARGGQTVFGPGKHVIKL